MAHLPCFMFPSVKVVFRIWLYVPMTHSAGLKFFQYRLLVILSSDTVSGFYWSYPVKLPIYRPIFLSIKTEIYLSN